MSAVLRVQERENHRLLKEAYAYCQKITRSHYENFPVASLLMPRGLRKHLYAIYAYARHADDLADEHSDREGLLEWRRMLHRAVNGSPEHSIFVALADTISRFALPLEPFDDLITAFLMDVSHNSYPSWEALLAYCRHSANPVGRIVLHLFGITAPDAHRHSDQICTALQLTNFWQDLKIDLARNRMYIPMDLLEKHRIQKQALVSGNPGKPFSELLGELVDRTRTLFQEGLPLLNHLRGRLKWEIRFTISGGLQILNKIEKLQNSVLHTRPVLHAGDWIQVMFHSPITKGAQGR